MKLQNNSFTQYLTQDGHQNNGIGDQLLVHGHDCAMILCRKLYNTKIDRQKLVQSLIEPVEYKSTHPINSIQRYRLKTSS